jgi:4a-hydroxytetrahydrobiopterin dehydratase
MGGSGMKLSPEEFFARAKLSGWKVVEGHHLSKSYAFPDFRTALDFVNRIGVAAEQQGHHPDVHLAWGQVDVDTWSHDVDGVTERDFTLAAEIDRQFFGGKTR